MNIPCPRLIKVPLTQNFAYRRKQFLLLIAILSICLFISTYLLLPADTIVGSILPNGIMEISSKIDNSFEYYERVSSYTNIVKIYNTEWYHRLSEIDSKFRDSIAKPFNKKQSLDIELNKSCLYLFDNQPEWAKGIGNRFLKINHVYIASLYSNCPLSIQWGISPKCNMDKNDTFNLYNTIFLDNEEIIASNLNPEQSTHFQQIFTDKLSLKECGASYMRGVTSKYPLYQNTKKIKDSLCVWNYKHKYQINNAMTMKLNAIDNDTKYSILWRFFEDHLRYAVIARFYGTLIYNLKMKYRAIIIKFIEKHFKNKFMIGLHFRYGNGEYMIERQQHEYNTTQKMLATCNEILDAVKIILSIYYYVYDNILSNYALFIVTDQYSVVYAMLDICNDLKKFFGKDNIFIRPQLAKFSDGYGHLFSDEWGKSSNKNISGISMEKYEEIKKYNFGSCNNILGDSFMDSELLGYSDALLLPHASTFTVLSKMMILKRHKILCGKMMPDSITYQCVYWDKYGRYANATTFWKNYTYSNDFNITAGMGKHWNMINAGNKWSIGYKERLYLQYNISIDKEHYINHAFAQFSKHDHPNDFKSSLI